jgi:hypothetical protein
MSKNEVDVKIFIEKYEKFLTINKFCLNNTMTCSSGEDLQVDEHFGDLARQAAYCVVITNTENKKEQYLQCLSDFHRFKPDDSIIDTYLSVLKDIINSIADLLGCFGESQDKQIENFKTLVEGLKSITVEIATKFDKDKIKNYMQKNK